MATRSDELTSQIETTRGRMDRTLDDLGERAGPGRLKQRMRGAVDHTRDTVMGVADQTRDRAAESGGGLAEGVRERSSGNPLAAGLVAFGAGLLAGSVLPESRTENKVAREVQSKSQGRLREEAHRSASELSDQVGARADEARERIAGETRQAKDDVASEASDRTDEVREHARSAADDVRSDVEDKARHHTGQ